MKKISIYGNGVTVVTEDKKITISGLKGGGGGVASGFKVGSGGAIGEPVYYPNNGGTGKTSVEDDK